ncbi:MAG TPA: hypothetical protein QF698_09755 [Candidatus Marinimicrobia bacterium]|nr:hypothetical protein [Candidatus Neomarinimicrobiota bacterium]
MFTNLTAERVPRRLAIYITFAIGVCISSVGCKGFNSTGKMSTSPKGGVVQKPALKPATQKPAATSQGKVMLVDQALGFCVINFMFVAQMPPSEQRYFVYRGNQQVGEIVTTAQTDETFLVADINKGDIREGDSVRPD